MAAQGPRTPTARTATIARTVASAPIFLLPFPPCLHYHRCRPKCHHRRLLRRRRPHRHHPQSRRFRSDISLFRLSQASATR
eukprot:4771679-Prymnesium_polylepis.1